MERKLFFCKGIRTHYQQQTAQAPENKARLQFFQEKLEHQVDDETALKHLQERYRRFLAGVVAEEESEAENDESAESGRRVQKYKRTFEDSIHQGQSFGTGRVAGLTNPAHCACAQPLPGAVAHGDQHQREGEAGGEGGCLCSHETAAEQ